MFMITAHGCCSASQQIEITGFHMWVTALWGNKGEGTLCGEYYLMCIGNTSCSFSYFVSICLIFVGFVFLSKINAMSQVSFYHPPILPFFSSYVYPVPVPFPAVVSGVGKREVS